MARRTLDEMLRIAEDGAHRIAQSHPRQLRLLIHGFRPSGPDVLVDVGYSNDAQKQLALARVRALFREHHVVGYAMIAESWMVQGSEGATVDTRVRPSKSPHRREIVMVTATDGMRSVGKMLGIERDYRGRISRLVEEPELAMPGEGELVGQMLDLLNPEA